MIKHKKQIHHFWPINYCQKPYQLTNWQKAKFFTYRCKRFILQFLLIKPIGTLIMYFIEDSNYIVWVTFFEQRIMSSIINWIVCISISFSLYYLVLFYHALKQPLNPYSPLLKFLTIKVTLFFTFWQKVIIGLIQQQIKNYLGQSQIKQHVISQTQVMLYNKNMLICFQMLIMSVIGGCAYSFQPYVSVRGTYHGTLRQVLNDTIQTFKNDFRLIRPKRPGFKSANQQKQLYPLNQQLLDRCSTRFQKIDQPLTNIVITNYFK